jgi:RNA polymerase sigma-70 factor (ECF subfamily)
MRLSGALAAIHELGAARWPDISMTTEDLARYAARVSLAEGAEAHAADVFLVCACLQGNARAVRELDRLIDLHTRSFVARIDTSPVFVDEVRQRIRERLLLGDEPRLARYSGAGPLIAWLRVLGVRLAVDMKRAPSGSRPTLSAEIGARLMYPSVDPELRLIETESRHAFEEALAAGTAKLTARQRAVLRLSLLGGLNIDEIGKIYSVHRATVARWIAAAETTVLNAAKSFLRSRHGLTATEIESLAGLLWSKVQISLGHLLAS